MNKLVILLIIVNTFSLSTFAQDPQFSQYFSSPLTLNPAYTGFFEGPQRLAMNFRNQWLGVGEPFQTGTISLESKLIKQQVGQENILGLGIMGMFDKTAGGTYRSNYLSISTAYHQVLDDNAYHHLGIGFQASMGTRNLDFNRVSFNEQFSSRGFDLSIYNGESMLTKSATYLDFNTGLMYNYNGIRNRYYLGTSLYHITRPSISFLGNDRYQLPMRITIHGGASWILGDHGEVHVSGQYMSQGAASNHVFGLAYGYSIQSANDNNVLYAGMWARSKDAIYPYLGYRLNNTVLGLSYDVTTSGLQMSAKHNRSFEISLIYDFPDKSYEKKMLPWY